MKGDVKSVLGEKIRLFIYRFSAENEIDLNFSSVEWLHNILNPGIVTNIKWVTTLIHSLKKICYFAWGSGVLWIERHRRAWGVKIVRIVTKFSTSQNKSNPFIISADSFNDIYFVLLGCVCVDNYLY